MKSIQSVRGMNDVVPAAVAKWQFVEDTARALLESYGYREIRPPLLERTELFARSIGDVTDIVEKEMYTFADRNGESLTLRPECTASVVRAAIENGLLHGASPRLWYMGPMFRYEKPQKGRYRQFHQIGAEVFGMPGPQVDAELILLLARLFSALGLRNIKLELNSLGTSAARARYRDILVDYLTANADALDADSQRRLSTNPLRILDSKNPAMQALIEAAPKLMEHIEDDCKRHFDGLRANLEKAGIEYTINPRLVRGLDYYSRTVFEWTTTELGAQGTVCGGGRYDGLVEQIGGQATPGVGFSIGIERLIELREAQALEAEAQAPDLWLLALGDEARDGLHAIAEQVRDALPGIRLTVDAEAGGAKAKFRRADRSGAAFALVVGETELEASTVTLKPLRGGEQSTVPVSALAEALRTALTSAGAPET